MFLAVFDIVAVVLFAALLAGLRLHKISVELDREAEAFLAEQDPQELNG